MYGVIIMSEYAYRLLNVFAIAGDAFSGNPLCVFEDGRGLDDATMQALALQFNLSETTFVLPSESANARVRIFTPNFEMPFAGHPTLGTAHVVRDINKAGDALTLEMKAGIIPVTANNSTWTLQANAPTWRAVEATHVQLADMLGIKANEVGHEPLWVNTGSEQLIIPLTSADAVRRCEPKVELLQRYGRIGDERFLAQVWSHETDGSIVTRFFFAKGNSYAEDPATGSACANLGGWFIASQLTMPINKKIRQGDAVKRPSELNLKVNEHAQILVSGLVVELGRGTLTL
jgi:trans-2,3-dihydro-3-hydroxyanthranilate isomerase